MSKRQRKIIAELDKQIARCQEHVSTGDAKADAVYRSALDGLANTFKTKRDKEAQKIGSKAH